MYWFTSDEHFSHKNIIKYCNRPFGSADEMNEEIIKRHNEVVKKGDIVIHAGDFSFIPRDQFVKRLNGSHTFLRGNHDHKGGKFFGDIWERRINNQKVVVSHYPMLRWNASHYNSWNLFGHLHGTLPTPCKQYDIGVDSNNFYPVSFDQLVEIMKDRPNNPDYLGEGRGG